ncbi:MAG: DUF2310 family Zn-ribbon-containing protein [Bacteroidetes bacterium]|nr:DUF2310 family Zn-ribbon-containing protein [Bacteroidota bacterium]
MYIQEITLELTPDLDADLMVDEFNWLMASFHRNGQVLSGAQSQFLTGNRIVCLPYTLEKDSLARKYNNEEVNKQLKRLENLCQNPISYRTIGVDYKNGNGTCQCENASSYVLTAFSFSKDSAVMCGECRLSIPLYRLPKTNEGNYTSILNWQLSSQIVDGLEIINLNDSTFPSVGKNIIKVLKETGRQLCKEIEIKSGIPTTLFEDQKKTRNDRAESGQEMIS